MADTVTSKRRSIWPVYSRNLITNNALETRAAYHVGWYSPASELVGQQVQVIRDFVTAMRGRLTDTRTLAHHVGQGRWTSRSITRRPPKHGYADGGYSPIPLYAEHVNFARRAYQTPGTVAAMIKFRQAIRNMNAGLPEWWKDQVSFEKADGGRFFANLLAFDPLNGFFGDKFRDPDQRDTRFLPGSNSPLPLGLVLNEANQYGPSIHPFLQYAIAASALLQGKKDQALSWVGYTSLPTKAFRALTVYARMGADRLLGEDRQHQIPAGGSILEPWLSFPTGDGVNVGDNGSASVSV